MKTKVALCISFCLCAVLHSQTAWTLRKDSENIKIYTRSSPHTHFDEYKATTTLNTNLNTVLKALLEAPQYNPNTCKSGISYYVKQLTKDKHVFYARKILPWPIQDRDIVSLLTVSHINSSKVKLTIESLPEGVPEQNKTLRIKELMGHWLLEAKGNQTKVTQQLYLNPEGKLPPIVVNTLLIKGPYKTFSTLKKLEKQHL